MALEELQRLAEAAVLDAAMQRKRMLVIVNPTASTMSARLRSLVVAALHGRYEVEAIDTQARDHATDLCREAAHEGYDVVVSFGGDGTVNEVANGLAGCATPLTCLPGGATNVLCKMLGIPGDIVDATEHLLALADRWQPRTIDLGMVNGRAFTYAGGFGIDASVVKRIEASPQLKRHRLREYFFVYAAVETVLRQYVRNPPRIDVEVGGETVRAITTLVQNGEQFTYLGDRPIHVADGGALSSGSLAGVALRGVRPRDIPTIAWRLLSPKRSVVGHRQVHGFAGVDGLRCTSADGRAIPLHVDGDHIGDVTEAVFAIRPGALSVVS
ncbi:MAG TPA: diacylglycerol kinase family protein [Solirubrobacteraceae bacterium]|jgi:diacylglycerol kinase family enzyme|nr:diacylglycerol kinase family protein [Solirubrobacteraceae bacterium]